MDRQLKRLQRVRRAAFCSGDIFLLHDNAPANKSTSVCQFMKQKIVTTLYQVPYSPDLTPPDYFFGPQVENEV